MCNSSDSSGQDQSHYIKVAQGTIFIEQNMRFGPVGNNEKKKGLGPIMSNF